MYADYDYYFREYLLGRPAVIPEAEYPYWEKQARNYVDSYTYNRLISRESLVTDEVRDCVCEIAETLYKAEKASKAAEESGLAGPLVSWSNDGQSGSVDLSQSTVTETGKREAVSRIIRTNLMHTGLLYAGIR